MGFAATLWPGRLRIEAEARVAARSDQAAARAMVRRLAMVIHRSEGA